jgi:CheY-like chemotaxis protein
MVAKIRIVDDDADFSANIAEILRGEGHEVSTRDRLEGAVEELVADTPDLLILDVMFPENPAGGFDLARAVRKRPQMKGLPIILLTAINQELPMDFSPGDIDEDWMPVQDFLEKPPGIADLLEKVDRLLGSSS